MSSAARFGSNTAHCIPWLIEAPTKTRSRRSLTYFQRESGTSFAGALRTPRSASVRAHIR